MHVVSTLKPLEAATKPLATHRSLSLPPLGLLDSSQVQQPAIDFAKLGWDNDCTRHGFAQAVHIAFAYHYPLVLRPDDIWLTILQSAANHLNAVAAQAKDPQPKETITVDTEGDDWPGVIAEFSHRINEKVGTRCAQLFRSGFSTSTPVDQAAKSIVLMDAYKTRFQYACRTMCGIPHINLQGTKEDWDNLVVWAAELGSELNLGWWTTHLLPVLGKIAAAFDPSQKTDVEFWSSIYKMGGGSGGPYITGWITVLFAYLDKYKRNPYLDWESANGYKSTCTSDLPSGLAQVDVTWNNLGVQIPLAFKAGFLEPAQDPKTLEIRAQVGWVVEKQTPPPE